MTSSTETAGQASSASHRFGPWIMLLILVAMWGSAFMMITVTVETIPPFTAVAIRLVTATLVLCAAAAVTGHGLPSLRLNVPGAARVWGMMFVLALTGNVIPFSLISWGQLTVPSSLAGILMAIMPLTTMGLAALFVPGETVTARRLGGFILGFIGLMTLFGPSALGLAGGETWLSQLAVLSGACFYAVNAVLTKHRPPMHPLAAAAAIHICACLVIVPVAFIVDDPLALRPSSQSLLAVMILGVFCSALATVILLRLIDQAGPTFTAQINYLVPIWAAMLGILVLGEEPGGSALLALALILGGIALAQTRARA